MSLIFKSLLQSTYSANFKLLVPFRAIHVTQVQSLYSSEALGIDSYLQSRKRIKEQFLNFSDKFRTKMNEFVLDQKNMIFTEDLKNMVHLAEPSDIELVLKMVNKFNNQNTEFRFGSFVFGPVLMRMFYFLDAPKEALECFYDPANKGFFDQQASYHILLDLLYNHEMYNEMTQVFENLKVCQINMTKFPKYPVVLIFAACFKQNTPESLKYAVEMWSEMNETGNKPLRRACTFFAALALKQNVPHIALESISQQKQHYVTIRNIKAMALAETGRVDDALPVLRHVLDIDTPEQRDKHTFSEETINTVRKAIEKIDDKDIKKEFENIEKGLRDRNLIDTQTLDQQLNTEIKNIRKPELSRNTMQQRRMPFGHRHRTQF